jgi:hypothetical protein|tara:strand:- start:12428 stop:12892 length:465 start_codon:yes stop_codon:yes gene_type:complete
MKLALIALVLVLAGASSVPAQARVTQPDTVPVCRMPVQLPDPVAMEDLMSLEPVPDTGTEEWFRLLLEGSVWPARYWPTVIEIARCESNFRPGALGDYEDGKPQAIGLMQVREDYHPRLLGFDLRNGNDNLAAAYVVFLEAGRSFRPWACWEGR